MQNLVVLVREGEEGVAGEQVSDQNSSTA